MTYDVGISISGFCISSILFTSLTDISFFVNKSSVVQFGVFGIFSSGIVSVVCAGEEIRASLYEGHGICIAREFVYKSGKSS